MAPRCGALYGVNGTAVPDEGLDPGITIHRITVGGGVMGALFAVVTALIFLLGVPASRWFLLASLLLGVAVASLLPISRLATSGPLTQGALATLPLGWTRNTALSHLLRYVLPCTRVVLVSAQVWG